MSDHLNTNKPKYPIYIPSKNRADVCYMAQYFLEHDVDFKIVVEPSQVEAYEKHFDKSIILVLPKDGLKLLGSRLWIREHSIANGYDRHWQFDDNIRNISRFNNGKRIKCDPSVAIRAIEDFTDRYSNVGVSGFNYDTFVRAGVKKPFVTNVHVYSASLINNQMPYKWRMYYNDDTDLCLQVLTNGLCTILFNAFLVGKMRTMVVKGGNTEDLYQKDGRLIMARSLEEMWPMFVKTKIRFNRPQHVVNWNVFRTPLIRRTDIDWDEFAPVDNYGLKLKAVKEVKSKRLQKMLENDKGV